jgi:hypothetical protein
VACNLLRFTEHVVDTFQPRGAAFDMRFVVQTKIATGVGRTLIVTKENDFDVGMKQRPTFQSVALDTPRTQ